MKVMDFSLNMYAEICKALNSHKVVTVEEYLLQKIGHPFVILRHDVDREINNALKMSELECRYGIKSTYYFRYPNTFNVEIISKIHKMGHEIGYHYEVLDKARGDQGKAIDIFQKELDIFRRHFPIKTVCMHGNPLTKWDGRDIWRYYDFRDFDLLGEAYVSCAGISIYLTDTGRNWNGDSNVKDKLGPQNGCLKLRSTNDLINFLNNDIVGGIYINCHPERWGCGHWGWFRALLRDKIYNLAKKVLHVL